MQRRARYRDEERSQILAAFERLRDPAKVATELGFAASDLDARIGRLSLRREVSRLLAGTAPPRVRSGRATPAAPPKGPNPAVMIRRRDERPAPVQAERRDPAVTPLEPSHRPSAPALAPSTGAGRFVAGPAARRDASELQGPSGSAALWDLIEAYKGNRCAIERRLVELYARPDGSSLASSDFDALLARHGLTERFRTRQIENIRFLFGFHKGAKAKVAQALLIDLGALDALLTDLGLRSEIEGLRERHRGFVRTRMPLAERLRLVLVREKYLADLGILEDVDRAVEAHVREAFSRHSASAPAASAVEERVRRELALDPETMKRLIRRYRLFGHARSLLASQVVPFSEATRPEIR
jgi:hypothetical protein